MLAGTINSQRSQSLSQTSQSCSTRERGYHLSGQELLDTGPASLELGPSCTKSILRRENWSLESICGSIRFRSIHKSLHIRAQDENQECFGEKAGAESEISLTVRPADWLSFVGIRSGFIFDFTTSGTRGWKHTISPISLVSDDAPIFELCKAGNLSAVQRLLSAGKASVKDTCPQGFQPLHVSLDLGITSTY